MKNDPYGERMKAYEKATQTVLPPRTYTIIRVDGRAFHTYLREAAKPFDPRVIEAMDLTAQGLLAAMSGSRFAYTQSDEISVLLTDLDPQSQPWFGGEVQKLASVAASLATAAFNNHYGGLRVATFDARAYTIPSRIEVANYFMWRQKDAIRNAISMAAQAEFSQKELHGKNTDEMQELLFQERGINFKNRYTDRERRGGVVTRRNFVLPSSPNGRSQDAIRSQWVRQDAPDFSLDDGSFLADQIPVDGVTAIMTPRAIVRLLGSAALAELIDTEGKRDVLMEVFVYFKDRHLARTWMNGLNPILGDESPLMALAKGRVVSVREALKVELGKEFA